MSESRQLLDAEIDKRWSQNMIKILFLTSTIVTAALLIWIKSVKSGQILVGWDWENQLSEKTQFVFSLMWLALIVGAIVVLNLQKSVQYLAIGMLLIVAGVNCNGIGELGADTSQLRTIVAAGLFVSMIALFETSFRGWQDRWHLKRMEADLDKSNHEVLGYESLKLRCLWICVPLFFVWSLLSLTFIIGMIVFGIYLSSRLVEAYIRRGRKADGLARRFAMTAFCCVLACVLAGLAFPEYAALKTFSGSAFSWQSPLAFGPLSIGLWCLIAIFTMVTILSRRQKDFTHSVSILTLIAVSFLWLKDFTFAGLACAIWLGPHLDSVLNRVNELPSARIWSSTVSVQRAIFAGFICANLCIAYFLVQQTAFKNVEPSVVKSFEDYRIEKMAVRKSIRPIG